MTAKNIARMVVLDPGQQAQLESLAASRSLPHALVMRAQAILMAAEGMQNIDIASKVGMTRETVGKWRKRFSEFGLQGLHDELRPGRPRTVSDERVAELLNRTRGHVKIRTSATANLCCAKLDTNKRGPTMPQMARKSQYRDYHSDWKSRN